VRARARVCVCVGGGVIRVARASLRGVEWRGERARSRGVRSSSSSSSSSSSRSRWWWCWRALTEHALVELEAALQVVADERDVVHAVKGGLPCCCDRGWGVGAAAWFRYEMWCPCACHTLHHRGHTSAPPDSDARRGRQATGRLPSSTAIAGARMLPRTPCPPHSPLTSSALAVTGEDTSAMVLSCRRRALWDAAPPSVSWPTSGREMSLRSCAGNALSRMGMAAGLLAAQDNGTIGCCFETDGWRRFSAPT
jgi:hypothetical protein